MSFILLYGPPGSGKTTLASSMTKLGLKVRFIDVDDKVRLMTNLKPLLENGSVKVTPVLSKLTETSMRESILNPKVKIARQPKGYLEICEAVSKYEETFAKGQEPTEQVLVIDSLTSMIEHMKRLISHLQGKTHFTFDEWAIVLSNLEEFFYIMKGLLKFQGTTYPKDEEGPAIEIPPKPGFDHVIIIAHDTTEKDEVTGKIQTLPYIEGQMRYKVGKYFEEVYYCLVEVPKTGEPIYKILTVSTDRYTARTSQDLPIYVNSDFSAIFSKEKPLDPIRQKIEEARRKRNGQN